MRIFLFLLGSLLLVAVSPVQAQEAITWKQLADIKFGPGKTGEPYFGAIPTSLEGKQVSLQGYMLPLTVDNKLFILSKYPYTECYFCGMAGKETVVELKLANPNWKFGLDEPVNMAGTLKLVKSGEGLVYMLENAKPLR